MFTSCHPREEYQMPAQPGNADEYIIAIPEDDNIGRLRGSHIKARNRVWFKLDSTVSLNGKLVEEANFGRGIKYILTNPDQLAHLPENKDSAVIFFVPGELKALDPKSERTEFDRKVKRTLSEVAQGLYPKDYNLENLPWAERPTVRFAFHFGPSPTPVKLPPWSDEEPDLTKLNPRNVFDVVVTNENELLVRGEKTKIPALTEMTKAFISNPDSSAELAESPLYAIVSLKNERGTNYEVYLKVYNALKAAYDELWDEKAQELYGKPYSDDMPFEQRKAIRSVIPMILSEAEPTDFAE